MQHVSDLHLIFALRPHRGWKYGRHPICDGWDYATKKRRKKARKKNKLQHKNIMTPLLHRAALT